MSTSWMQTAQGQTTALEAGTLNLNELPEKLIQMYMSFLNRNTQVSTAQLATGSQPPKRAKKFIAKDSRIEELKKRSLFY